MSGISCLHSAISATPPFSEVCGAADVLQHRKVMQKTLGVVKASVIKTCNLVTDKINVADLGCSSGLNTLFLIHEILLAVTEDFKQKKQFMPDVHFFMNDLPGNDFNALFRSIAPFRARLHHLEEDRNGNGTENAPLYISGVPCSFYGRIFPKNSMHFFHSCSSVHWLSQVPSGLHKDGISSNKRNVYLAKTSPLAVIESYQLQYRKDFALFLRSRAQEIVDGGRMVLSMLGREEADPTSGGCCHLLSLMAEALDEMVCEGLIEEDELEKFNLPFYSPSLDEMRAAIQEEGSFNFEQGHIYKGCWDATVDIYSCEGDKKHDNVKIGRNVAGYVRAPMEPLLRKHFGEIDIDEVFRRVAKKVAVVPHGRRFHVNIAVELEKICS